MTKEKLIAPIKETIDLMRPFKWYILLNVFIILTYIIELIYPPAKDDPIFNAEAYSEFWNYANQELYIEYLKFGLIYFTLILLLGTSNMRNHPKLAKFIFLFPLIRGIIGNIWDFIVEFL